jgi:hypothetical protein
MFEHLETLGRVIMTISIHSLSYSASAIFRKDSLNTRLMLLRPTESRVFFLPTTSPNRLVDKLLSMASIRNSEQPILYLARSNTALKSFEERRRFVFGKL